MRNILAVLLLVQYLKINSANGYGEAIYIDGVCNKSLHKNI